MLCGKKLVIAIEPGKAAETSKVRVEMTPASGEVGITVMMKLCLGVLD